MRRYIRNDQLIYALHQITDNRDARLVEIYREVILYRTAKHSKQCATAARMLACPRLLVLSLTNALTLMISGFILHDVLSPTLPGTISFLLQFGITAFALFEGARLFRFLSRMRESMPYLIIDELFARRILILQKTQNSRRMKAAK